jgi:non-ribosomal peptide synthetase component E (peptide arylation enzyme)
MTADGYFRTGDLGRLDAEGCFYFAGREKEIIRRGGVTIVPGEVEAALLEHPRIDRVAIIALPDPRMGERACACVITADGRPIELDELTAFLAKQSIARYMWPERVELFDEFPFTPSLKVRKQGLVELVVARDQAAAS